MRSLHRHSRIASGRSLDVERVAVLVVLIHFGEFHLEGGPLVFLHPEVLYHVAGLNAEQPCQARSGQCELCAYGAELVGNKISLLHNLVVGIAQPDRQLFVGQHLMLKAVLQLVGDGCYVYRLARSIDGTVGVDVEMFSTVIVVVIAEVAISVHGGTGPVGCGGDEDFLWQLVLLVGVAALSVLVGGERGNQCVLAIAAAPC